MLQTNKECLIKKHVFYRTLKQTCIINPVRLFCRTVVPNECVCVLGGGEFKIHPFTVPPHLFLQKGEAFRLKVKVINTKLKKILLLHFKKACNQNMLKMNLHRNNYVKNFQKYLISSSPPFFKTSKILEFFIFEDKHADPTILFVKQRDKLGRHNKNILT